MDAGINIMNCLHGHAWIVEPAVYLTKTTDKALTRQILKSTPVIGDHHTTGKSWYNLSKTSILILFKTCATFWGVFLFVFFVIKLNCIYFVLLILSKGTVSQRGGFKYRFHMYCRTSGYSSKENGRCPYTTATQVNTGD